MRLPPPGHQDGGTVPMPLEVDDDHVTCIVHPNVGRNDVSHSRVQFSGSGDVTYLSFCVRMAIDESLVAVGSVGGLACRGHRTEPSAKLQGSGILEGRPLGEGGLASRQH